MALSRPTVVALVLCCLASIARASCDPPPPPSCTAGRLCTSAAQCGAGYDCLDNGTGTKYCVGVTCSADGDCGGGGAICRQYCTKVGDAVECGGQRCQCPGLGCVGTDVICMKSGTLACRMLCSQDSDCVDPFGLVCVNSGFAFGVCIGHTACQ